MVVARDQIEEVTFDKMANMNNVPERVHRGGIPNTRIGYLDVARDATAGH